MLEQNTIKKVLAFGRRRHFNRVRQVVTELFSEGTDIQLISDERLGGANVRWWGDIFYKEWRNRTCIPDTCTVPLTEIVSRCRYLRTLPTKLGYDVAYTAYRSWELFLDTHEFDLIFLLPIDSFVLDTLQRVAKRKKIPAFSPIGTVFSNRFRFTVRGELLGTITENKEIIDGFNSAVDLLSSTNFRPDFLMGVNNTISVTALRRMIIDSLKPPFYFMYRYIFQDPLSFSFSKRSAQMARMMSSFSRMREILSIEKNALQKLPEQYVLLPLQFYPEATNDYWIAELEMCNHHKVTLNLARDFSKFMPVVIKEHPASIGRRNHEFLRMLSQISNVYFVPAMTPMGYLVEKASLVVGYASTTLLQATLLNIPVLYCGTPYYGNDKMSVLSQLLTTDEHIDLAKSAIASKGSREDAINILRSLFLSSGYGSLGSFAPMGEKLLAKRKDLLITSEVRQLLQQAVVMTS
ncbi:MAG: hypothetical protein JJT82_06505 [Legionellaceae bacterium]|nr:hypothetical protein [Legionellaceae bacterium]